MDDEVFETWTIPRLKAALRARGAVLRGKKADLIARLKAYIRNQNFVQEDNKNAADGEEVFHMVKPPIEQYKDVHGATQLPAVTSQRIELFLLRFGRSLSQGPVDLYRGQYLQCARSATATTGATYVSGICRAQMKQTCYNVDLHINSDGSVNESQCDCAAGVGPHAHCKHILVLLLAVQDVTENKKIAIAKVCTERLQTFHKPKRPFNGSPVKADNMKMLSLSREGYDPRPAHLRKVAGYQDSVTNTCVNYAATYESRMPFMQTISPANPYGIENDHSYAGDEKQVLLKMLKLREISEEEREEIEVNTRGQSTNKEWKSARACRLTSSRFKDIIQATERRDMQKLAESIGDPKFFISKATEHGIVNEKVAINKFLELYASADVTECGLIVDSDLPFLGASPDGLIGSLTTVGVKCPFAARYKPISPATVPYLEYSASGELQLKKTHAYYYQVMGQLMATKREFCDFIVYTYVDLVRISINRDQDFIDRMIPPLQKFFDTHFFPYLMDKHVYHGYDGQ